MKFEEMAIRYCELANMSNPTSEEEKRYGELRRTLSARGLNPKNLTGLVYRAKVYDNRAKIATMLSLHDGDSRRGECEFTLIRRGIKTKNTDELKRLLAEFKVNAKEIDKKKTTKGVSLARRATDQMVAEAEVDLAYQNKVHESKQTIFKLLSELENIGINIEDAEELKQLLTEYKASAASA